MVTARVGSLSLVNDTLRDVTATQNKLGELQNQISSGLKSQDFQGLNGDVEQFNLVTGQLDRTKQYSNNNLLNVTKLQTADVALGKISDIADKIKVAIVAGNGAVLQTSNLAQNLTNLLAAMGAELNATFNGRYIFGGTDTDHPPVPDTSAANNVVGVPDDNYYAGAKQDATLRADERTEIAFPVRADHVAFQKIYAAARQAIVAANANDSTSLNQAQQLIQQGIDDLSGLRSQAGSVVDNINTINDRLKQLTTYWTQLTDDVSKTDIVAASTQVSSYQAILQASFQVYARLSQLRLSDYLK